ncbi:adenylate/guanylate cyclase domain-containing protein [Acidithiobacillus ferrooxidans]|uniref:adenylate/guanylate cyclase domain-containing protein n=1 Tax=Acidithiobacillus ferrooxidans TaxID=920 RepID=UPI00214BEF5C|nr:adenylate/guanylate cyclase domain-containing protein [Acidithiobacillus ferrooxidans]MCR2830806.1 adenylate/guanylate cyclase domain-containing protein [Acidithiobacillus ferrooxidans]
MGLFSDLSIQVDAFLKQRWESDEARVVPDPDDLRLRNHAKKLNAVVLYADLADSTALVDAYEPQVVTRLYKSFLHCAASLIRANNGEIVAYDGDRIMAIYIGDSKNTNAVATSFKINYAVNEIINQKSHISIKHVVGIDRGDLFISRIGIRNANDLVWVGRAANYAAKLSSQSDNYQTYVTDDIYQAMARDLRERHSWLLWPKGWKPYPDANPIKVLFSNSSISFV